MTTRKISIEQKHFLFDPNNKQNILREKGKFSSVYKGIEESTGKTVVIKKFNPIQKFPEAALEQFKNEATFSIDHPRVAQTIGYTCQENEHFIIKEYVPGCNIIDFLKESKLKGNDRIHFIVKSAMEVLDGLDALHQNQIIHCDIRPHNILIQYTNTIKDVDTNTPSVKIIDLGLAKRLTEPAKKRVPFSLIYSPPEQLLNIHEAVNASSDLYSLAISMYEILTDTKPFYHHNPELLMHLQINQNLKSTQEIPVGLLSILQKATYKHTFKLPPNKYKRDDLFALLSAAQSHRFKSAKEFKDALAAFL
jgi:serine/threonine protein kinase